MKYKTPKALEMAVKESAKSSPMDTGKAISSFYFHRFLCRVFWGGGGSFVLKGGQSMLARTIDARATRDIDLLSQRGTLDDALKELLDAAKVDLGDYMSFMYEGSEPIKAEDEYRSGLKVSFTPWIGPKKLLPISIDLVVDEIPLEGSELITPADRIEVSGIETCDYLVYPVEAALTDKYFGIIERHDGRPSSRVKDLVDIVVYAGTCDVDGSVLQRRLHQEERARKIGLNSSFAVPSEWVSNYNGYFLKLYSQTGMPSKYRSLPEATKLAQRLFDPVLMGKAEGLLWSHEEREWSRIPSGALRVEPYTPEHADELRAVCLSQASERARTDEAHREFTLLMYCDAYLEHGVAYMLVDESGVARGYVLAAEDAHAWRRDFEPYRRRIAELGITYKYRVAEELDFYEGVADEYPAHLHIDIAEEWTGRGGGCMLIEALLARLRADGVSGVVFGVAASNERAVGFYRHMGFSKLSEYSDGAGYTFCMRL